MLASRPKSGLSEASNGKGRPGTPTGSKLGRAGSLRSDSNSQSPQQKSRIPTDRSLKSVNSKPDSDRRSAKTTTPPNKQSHALKVSSELQAQLDSVQEDLKKANEQLAAVEIEKACAINELNGLKRLADEANGKLTGALLAQKRAEEKLEIEKFRADELEQGSIEAAQKKEEEHEKELESISNQHAADAAALVAATKELQKVRSELQMASEAKIAALSHADDITKNAEVNTEKVELLAVEVTRLNALLDSNTESMSSEASELVKKLDSEVKDLKNELERKKDAERKLLEMETLTGGLQIELSNAKKAESRSSYLIEKWKKKVELLEAQVEEAIRSEKSSLDSLASVMNQLDGNNTMLEEVESKVAALNGKVACLEIEVDSLEADLKESARQLKAAQQEALELGKSMEVMKTELQTAEEVKLRAMESESAAASSAEILLQERNKLMNELEVTKDEAGKAKKAMEGLASALHEVSTEATKTQERLLMKQAEIQDDHAQIEELRSALKNTGDSYELLLDEAKYEIVCLKKAIERSEVETNNLRQEWDAKEINLVNAIKRSEEELASLKEEKAKAAVSLDGAESEKQAAKDDVSEMMNKLSEAESEVTIVNEAVKNVKVDTLRFKERLLDKENELQSITQENDELRIHEAAALDKIKELSTLLAHASSSKPEENGKLPSCDKENATLQKAIGISQQTTCNDIPEKLNLEKPFAKLREDPEVNDNGNGNKNDYGEEPGKVEVKMWESHKMVDKTFSMERRHETEFVDDEKDLKLDSGSFDQTNGSLSEDGSMLPNKLQQRKKKKAFMHKFGGLLKKKSDQKQ